MTRNAWGPSNWIFTPYARMGNTPPARSGKVDDLRFRQAMPQATPSSRYTYTNGAGANLQRNVVGDFNDNGFAGVTRRNREPNFPIAASDTVNGNWQGRGGFSDRKERRGGE